MQDLERDFEAITRARCACAAFNVEADASTAETFAHVGEVKIMTNCCEELPPTVVLGQRVLVLTPCDTETLRDVHVEEEFFEGCRGTFVVAVQNFDTLREVMFEKMLVEKVSIDTLLFGAA